MNETAIDSVSYLDNTGDDPAVTATPGDVIRYTLRLENANDTNIDTFSIVDELDRLNASPYFVAGTLVNTGLQVFSGTVLGSKPVLIYDDEFRFDVNLATGATTGNVFLTERIAGPRIKCELEIVGTGFTPEGDGLANYSGRCKMRTNK